MNTLTIYLRPLARKLKIHEVLHFFRLDRSNAYERKFNEALRSAVRPGDTVWDVGANVGHYSGQFCEWVGDTGRVVAFEPNPIPFGKIKKHPRLTVENAALGASEGTARLTFHSDTYTGNGHISHEGDEATWKTIPIQVLTGDSVAERIGIPNVVKIDVEGFEDDVIEGMRTMLSSPQLRSVLMEVHFAAFRARGRANGPKTIERSLKDAGFAVKWVDRNHIHASR